ncbi:DUF29 family protein [Duganella sp.]|uniref:DUF29 family protein n=1 Tax=Duganella sp. TaxID=1904440 RepID=UPI0031DA5D62
MAISYEHDVAAWAKEQVTLLRAGQWALLDVDHNTMKNQREAIAKLLQKMPSLRQVLEEVEWDEDVWKDALDIGGREADLVDLPAIREWDYEQVLKDGYLPS